MKTLNKHLRGGQKIKKIIICLFLLVVITSLSSVSAEKITDSGNFTELHQNVNDSIEITEDDANLSDEEQIDSNQNQSDGNNESDTIDNDTDVELNSISSLVNVSKEKFSNSTIHSKIIKTDTGKVLNFKDKKLKKSKRIKISAKIKKVAKKIAKKSKGLKAAKKLAKWVNKRIKHETKSGFYQSPKKTLKRKKGNCCSKSELFLQMCCALGINKKHKLYFIQVGSKKFKHRHFYTRIDKIYVDVDHDFKNPWGKRGYSKKIFRITKYPNLPIKRRY